MRQKPVLCLKKALPEIRSEERSVNLEKEVMGGWFETYAKALAGERAP